MLCQVVKSDAWLNAARFNFQRFGKNPDTCFAKRQRKSTVTGGNCR